MTTPDDVFGKPYNWCDRICERCVLEDSCDLARRDAQLRWRAEAAGRDPDDWGVVMEQASSELGRALEMLQEAAAEDGIDLDAPLPTPVVVLEAERMHRTGMRVVKCLVAYQPQDEAQAEAVADCMPLASKLAAKVARISSYVSEEEREREVWALDGMPNMLLIEHVRERLRPALEAAEPSAPPDGSALNVLGALDAQLAPLIAAVSAEARAALAALIEQGAAPSPFCLRLTVTPGDRQIAP